MKFIKFPIVPLLFGFSIGILIQYYFSLPLFYILFGLFLNVICFCIGYFLNTKKKLNSLFFESFVVLLCLNLGALSSYFNIQIHSKTHISNFISEKNIVQGVVSEKLKSSTYYNKFILKAAHINGQKCIGKILLYVPKKHKKEIEVGNKIKLFETPKLLQNALNPNQFDYSKYLKNQNVFHQIKIKETNTISVSTDTNFYYYINLI